MQRWIIRSPLYGKTIKRNLDNKKRGKHEEVSWWPQEAHKVIQQNTQHNHVYSGNGGGGGAKGTTKLQSHIGDGVGNGECSEAGMPATPGTSSCPFGPYVYHFIWLEHALNHGTAKPISGWEAQPNGHVTDSNTYKV
eukprot:1150152-Pelagomonas_calceolata.AAC.2